MNNSKKRRSGGAYRHRETMLSLHAKAGKNRSKARGKGPRPKREAKA